MWAGGEGGDDVHVRDAVDGEEGEKKEAEGRPEDGRPEGSRSELRVRIRVRVRVTHSPIHRKRGEAVKKRGGQSESSRSEVNHSPTHPRGGRRSCMDGGRP